MGLTIHYSLQAQPRITKAEAHAIVETLHQCAMSLLNEGMLVQVSPILQATTRTIESYIADKQNEWNWVAVQSSVFVKLGEAPYQTFQGVTPIEGYLFRTWAGEGSEEANFGLMRYPKRIDIELSHSGKAKQSAPTGLAGWCWSSFCKTTYAIQPVAAHLAVIAMLDYAASLPELTVAVSDEGEYWETRDVVTLAQNFAEDAVMLAGLAHALGPSAVAPIRERGDYDNLVERSKTYQHTFEILKKLITKPTQDQ